jgi:hypothetical protein
MLNNEGKWIGWGPRDSDPKVAEIKAFLKRKFTWVREFQPPLDNTGYYDENLTVIVGQMQGNYELPVTGIMDYATQVRSGFYKPAPQGIQKRPVFFTVEGHMSRWDIGPCAFIAADLEREELVWHQGVGYNSTKLPFDNRSGIDELAKLMRGHTLPNGRPFPPGTPWGLSIFSQGGIIGCEFMLQYVLPQDGELHWRLKDFVGCVAYGNPYRAKNVIADWVPDKPKNGTFGIADKHLDPREWYLPAGHKLHGQPLSTIWREHSRKGDVYAEIPDDEVGMNITSIYRIVSNNSWVGGPTAVFSRLMDFLTLPDDIIPLAWSIIKFLMFGINMGPHGQYDLTPCRNFMRDRFRA